MSPKVPMALAISNLSEIMEAIDAENGDINGTLNRLFDEKRLDLIASIDRRVIFLDVARGQLKRLEELSDIYSLSAKKVKNAIDWLEENTKKIMASLPEYPYKGTLGEFKVQDNQPALKYLLPTNKVSVDSIIDESSINQWRIDQKYLVQRNFYCLHNETVKTDLKNGVTLSWATLTRGQKLKINRK